MFNDFKIRTYSNTPNKLRVLKDIFDRLNLFNFQERLNKLSNKIDILKKLKKALDDNPPNPPVPTEFGFGEFLIIHAHNPEEKEIGGLITDNLSPAYSPDPTPINRFPQLYIDDIFICNTPQILIEHNFPIVRLSDYGFLPGWHRMKCVFNNIESSLGSVYIAKNSITNLVFEFERTDAPLDYNYTCDEFTSHMEFWPGWYYDIWAHVFSPDGLRVYFQASENDKFTASVGYTINPKLFSLTLSISGTGDNPSWGANVFTIGYGSSWPLYHSWGNLLPINIPLSTEFSEWYIQYSLEGYYPPLSLESYGAITQFLVPNSFPSQYQNLLEEPPDTHTDPINGYFVAPANKDYTRLFNARYTPNIRLRVAGISSVGIGDKPTESINGEFLYDGIKFSSIPYDLEGTSF